MAVEVRDAVGADVAVLTGESARELMVAVLSAVGGRLVEWTATQVAYRPGAATTASYTARVRWADGSVTSERLGACSGSLPDGVARLGDGRTEIGMWRFPFDPALPGLPAAMDLERMRRLLGDAGLGAGGLPRPRVRAYRPMRRAVVEVSAPGGARIFVKAVHPRRARRLHERHRVATAAGVAVPASLGWTDDGLVVLTALPGRTLREELITTGANRLDPDRLAGGVVGVLDALPVALATGRRRRTWGQKAPHYAEVIAGVLPPMADRARRIAASVDHDTPEGPDVAVHGDFYESQLMVADGRIAGLLDIDTAGRGERLDDAACLLAHLAVLAQIRPDRAEVINRLGSRLERRFSRDLGRAALARRTAAVVLSLATGPHRVQEAGWPQHTERRVALAEQWLAFAEPTAPSATSSTTSSTVESSTVESSRSDVAAR
ncbi:phosphotransferase family protein [Actinophytocola sp.]|uniref:phosphotransferase family protein n=1 Tax=Actinophytocola sp. TaxID=1872138 RepID=UPI003D6A8B08